MARAALGWTLDDLAAASAVSRRTVARYEAGEAVLPPRIEQLRHAFEDAGVSFIDTGPLTGGVVPPAGSL